MHFRRFGSSVSQKAVGARKGVLLGMIVPLPAGQPLEAGDRRRMTAVMHFGQSTVS